MDKKLIFCVQLLLSISYFQITFAEDNSTDSPSLNDSPRNNSIVQSSNSSASQHPPASYQASLTPDGVVNGVKYKLLSHNGRRYAYGISKRPHGVAARVCAKLGMTLAIISDEEENDFLSNYPQRSGDEEYGGYIGLQRRPDNNFVWPNGCPVESQNWAKGEPSESTGRDDCVNFAGTKWNDIFCETELNFYCELNEDVRRCDQPSTPEFEVNCDLHWSSWSECSESCGGGVRTRYTQDIIQPEQLKKCTADETRDSEVCNKHKCDPDPEDPESVGTAAPFGRSEPTNPGSKPTTADVSCEFHWSEWSECSKSCGFGVERRRTASKISETQRHICPKHSIIHFKPCHHGVCQQDPECPEMNWSRWSPCSVSCGHGIQRRSAARSASTEELRGCSSRQLLSGRPCDSGVDCPQPTSPPADQSKLRRIFQIILFKIKAVF